MIHQIRVIFGDTDQMGVVYYANYLRYFEAARAEYLRQRGRSGRDLDEWGVTLPVVEAHCRYRRPAQYEDLLDIHIEVEAVAAASFRFAYRVMRENDHLADGWTLHACVGRDGKPHRFPAELRALLSDDGPV
jgi:acyl-CoA thioester hydrolase